MIQALMLERVWVAKRSEYDMKRSAFGGRTLSICRRGRVLPTGHTALSQHRFNVDDVDKV